MKIATAVGAVIIGVLCGISPVLGTEKSSREDMSFSGRSGATEFGITTPPIGYLAYCGINPQDCKATGGRTQRLAMSPERWTLLKQVNTYVNGKIAPVSDQDLYGEPERWTIPTDAGDCEDYLLLKKAYLQSLGFPAETLLITVVLDERNEGHAILTVATETGDYILDNRTNEIRGWRETEYRFLKRQSQADPLQWVALVKDVVSGTRVSAKGGNR